MAKISAAAGPRGEIKFEIELIALQSTVFFVHFFKTVFFADCTALCSMQHFLSSPSSARRVLKKVKANKTWRVALIQFN